MTTDYALLPAKWGASAADGTSGGTVTWSLSGSFSSVFQSEISAAFTRWSQVANISFVHAQDGGSANITLSWASIDGSGSILGQANYTYSSGLFQHADITFDSAEQWTPTTSGLVTAGSDYFETLALHEIGHALGLDHYNATTAVMNAYLAPNLHDLTQSDIDGIQAIYGAAAPPSPQVSSTSDGGWASLQYDTKGQYTWSSLETDFDALGNRTRLVYNNDDGSHTAYQYDPKGQYNWASLETDFDALWRQTKIMYSNDDGSHTAYQYDVKGQNTWSSLETDFDALGNQTRIMYNNDDSTHTAYQYDTKGQYAWSSLETDFDALGNQAKIVYGNDDGSHTVYQYDVTAQNTWSSIETDFDALWHQTRVVCNNDDGSHTVTNFNTNQTIASTHTFASDWSLIA